MRLVHGFGEALGLAKIRLAGLHPDQVGMRRIGDGAGDARLDAVLDLIEALDRAAGLVIDKLLVALVNVGGQKLGGLGVGARDDQRRRAHDIGGEARGVEVADMGGGRNQNLAAEMAAFLLRGQLVLIMHARSARLDEGLHDLKRIERPAEPGLRVGDDRRKPCVDRQALRLPKSRSGRRAAKSC